MEFHVLGPLRVSGGGGTLALGGPRQRAVLAALILRANETVTPHYLAKAVWDTEPASPRTNLRTYVSGLRKSFGEAEAGRLVTRADGYLLRTDQAELDFQQFNRLAADGEEALRQGEPERAAELLRRALDLWRGEPLEGLATGPLLRAESERLAERHLVAVAQHARALIRLQRHTAVISDLTALVRQHPLREELLGLLMLALYRGGRIPEALQAFQDGRRELIDRLGTEPGAELQQLHQRLLTATTASGVPEPGIGSPAEHRPAPRRAHPAVPRQLPLTPRLFTGRCGESAVLTQGLAALGDAVVISVIAGSGGIGKTWLALHWAHRHTDRFPDGQLYVDLRGFDSDAEPTSPESALRGFLDALGVEPDAVPAGLEAQAALYRSLTAGKRMLVLLDSARDTEQVLPLLPGGSSCMVLITSRHQLGGLVTTHGALPLVLDPLGEAEAHALLARHLGQERLYAEPGTAGELLSHCGGSPLALGIVAARAAAHPARPLTGLARELRNHATRLDALDAGEARASIRTVLAGSLRSLKPETAWLFTLLGLVPGPDISLSAAAGLFGLPTTRARLFLRELEDVHLIRQYHPGRYTLHNLVRLYAAERADDQPAWECAAALRRLLDFYAQTASTGARLLDPRHSRATVPRPAAGGEPTAPDSASEALAWFHTERRCLLAAQHTAVERGWDIVARQLAWAMDVLRSRGQTWDTRHTVTAISSPAAASLSLCPPAPARAATPRTPAHSPPPWPGTGRSPW
ncbi:AfsR/SARP family transcriptional regulator [Streptomyces sp. LX-29]|uniref:AfsR/SARP family transcriptional regulator n=1 Tax=Streptomyces sp. LX-29 TaxID=2900152 RepID=UPI00240E2AA8|nr:AfsR/SARP family transcriptional regulator [Streptomyces sp. LX-29]